MNQDLGLRVLGQIMGWDDDRARREFAWLRLMSRLKYDAYQDFVAGMRFVESLASWMQQFSPDEREIAYAFLRRTLVYVGTAEMSHLVDLAYPEEVRRRLVRAVAARSGIPGYRVLATPEAQMLYSRLLRQTLFMGLSDGARIDVFRRANEGIITNEQVVVGVQVDDEKWEDLLHNLQRDLGPAAKFAFVYLLDDFVGSGKTLLRNDGGSWKGKLDRFWKNVKGHVTTHFEGDWTLCVHHYLASRQASEGLIAREVETRKARQADWFPRVEFSFGMVLPPDLPVDPDRDATLMTLIDKYYDPAIETTHTGVGGGDVKLGFGACALPLVLEHNTPNNSIALLWAETAGANGKHAMRPLFRRRQRHI